MNDYPDDKKMHHYMGIEMNIQTWSLLEKKERSEQDVLRMIMFAKASLYHWKHSPNFQPINEQRGEWMISRVFAVLGKGETALSHAEKTIELTEKYGLKEFDLAYAYEALARANATLGNTDKCKKWWKKAKEAGNLIKGKKNKKYFIGDLEMEPWFDSLD